MFEHRIVLKEKKSHGAVSVGDRLQDLRYTAGGLPSTDRIQNDIIPIGVEDDELYDESEYQKYAVVFESTPEIQEQATVSYLSLDEIRAAGSHSVYMGSPARVWNISHKFISRTPPEAEKTWKAMNLLRSWRQPKKGWATDISGFGAADTSAPAVLNLFGYGRTFRGIPVVITNLSIDWNTESDYIKSRNGSDIPIILPVSISLKEMRTINDMQSFNLEAFREGRLIWW